MRKMDGLGQQYSRDWKLENNGYGTNKLYSLPDKPHYRNISTPAYNTSCNNSSYTSSSWSLEDPEVKRRRRVAKYKAYAVEGRLKSSIRSGFRWVKNKYSGLVHGY